MTGENGPSNAPTRPGLKTWSSLLGNRKRPSEYEVVSYKLHYRNRNADAAYEQSPDSMMNKWYREHVFGSPLQHPDWDAFRDPDEVTYRSYCTMQDGQEQFVDVLLNDHNENRHDASLSPEWAETLARMYTPARYLFSALQMASAYLVQIAPASTITNCAVFQEADQYRWLSRIAYRTAELKQTWPDLGFGEREREVWETAPEWQGFRELMEKVLATFDWGETLVALNFVAIRAADAAFIHGLSHSARAHGDTLTAMMLDNQNKDALRSQRWTKALAAHTLAHEPNRAVVEDWLEKWVPLGDKAIAAYCAGLPEGSDATKAALDETAAFRAELGFAGKD